MSEQLYASDQANPEISFDEHGVPLLHVAGRTYVTHPDYMNLLPHIERQRLKYEEFRQRAVEQNLPQPTRADWARTFELTETEVEAAIAIEQRVHESQFQDLSGYSLVRDFGGQPRIVWRRVGGLIGHMKVHDFKNAHREKLLRVGEDKQGAPRYRPLVDAWLERTRTPRYETVEFMPGRRPWEVPHGVLNLWAGWPDGLERERELRPHVLGDPIPESDAYDGGDEPNECSIFLEHLYENVCGGDSEVYNFILGWMAEGLQRPGHSEAAVVMTGPSGSGKGTFAELYGSLFGPHFISTSKREHVIGKFNRHLQDCQLLFGDEIDFKSSAEANQQLRNLVTEPMMPVEAKGVDVVQSRKHFRVMIATNERHVVGALQDDRRFLVLEVDAGESNRDRAFFATMRRQWYEEGGRIAFFRWLTGRYWRDHLETGGWDVGQRPETEALRDQKIMSLSSEDQLLLGLLDDGVIPGARPTNRSAPRDTALSNSDSAEGGLYQCMRNWSPGLRNESDQRLAAMLKRWGCAKWASNSERGWTFPPLGEMRASWVRRLGSRDWPDDANEWHCEPMQVETPF